MICPTLTFNYRFEVQDSGLRPDRWIGQGSGRSAVDDVEGLAGSKPRFELRSGWLTLLPTEGWARSFPTHSFSDQPQIRDMDEAERAAAFKARGEAFEEAQREAFKEAVEKIPSPKDNFDAFTKENNAASERALRRRGMARDFASFSLFVGDTLSSALQTRDELKYSRNGSGDFYYSVERNSETVFSAGSVGRSDLGGSMAVWQEYDRRPNPDADRLKERHPTFSVAEWIYVPKPYVTARIQQQQFHLLDGQEAQIDRYYVFLARSNQEVPAIAFEFTPRAVHSAGRLDLLSKDQIIEAGQKLTGQNVRLL